MNWPLDFENQILQGDCQDLLRQMPDESVQCCITSSPYFGLRDYKIEPLIWGGREECGHEWGQEVTAKQSGGGWAKGEEKKKDFQLGERGQGQFCSLCGAWKGSLGLEPEISMFIEHLVEIFREVKRVLRKDGTLWLNLGDSYASGKGTCYNPGGGETSIGKDKKEQGAHPLDRGNVSTLRASGLKPKDLCEIPSDVVRALRADGWYLRSRIPWLKRNSMPESVTDRPATAIEYVFLLTKSARCFYDNEAVKVKSGTNSHSKGKKLHPPIEDAGIGFKDWHKTTPDILPYRNRRNSDWFFESWQGLYEEDGEPLAFIVNPKGFPDAHFATFPPKLVEPCIKAGTSERGACSECGAPWERMVGRTNQIDKNAKGSRFDKGKTVINGLGRNQSGERFLKQSLGWRPTCKHYDQRYKTEFPKAKSARKRYQRDAWGDWWRRVRQRPGTNHWPTVPCVCLDPFSGAGTTALVALQLGRDFVGLELSPEYCAMAEKRIEIEVDKIKYQREQPVLI